MNDNYAEISYKNESWVLVELPKGFLMYVGLLV